MPESDQVADVSRFHPKRQGDGVALEAILERAGVAPGGELPDAARRPRRLPRLGPARSRSAARGSSSTAWATAAWALEHGGPIRFLIRDPAACHTDELDDCANVKYLSRIELTSRRGRDTRPTSEAEHEALHQAQSG